VFRRPMRRGPGLVGAVARTAVVAGTATAVSGAVAGRQQAKHQAKAQEAAAEQAALDSQQQIGEMQTQMDAMQAQQAQAAIVAAPAPTPAAPAPAAGGDVMAQLQQLVQMKDAGMLTDAEFTAAKAEILGI
jgi:hypothetical protein